MAVKARRPELELELDEVVERHGRKTTAPLVAEPSAEPQLIARAAAAGPGRARAALAAADVETRAALVLRLQQERGNAVLARRVLARQPAGGAMLESPEDTAARAALEAALQEPDTEPHGGGGGEELLGSLLAAAGPVVESVGEVLGGIAGQIASGIGSLLRGLGGLLGFGGGTTAGPAAPEQAPSGPAPTTGAPPTTTAAGPQPPAEDPAVTETRTWLETAPTTNVEWAQWILDAETKGFATFRVAESKKQMTKLAAGEKVAAADPSQAATLGGLQIIHDLITAKVGVWLADSSKPKQTVVIGSFLRAGDAHGTGRMIDVNGLDWTGPDGPAQVADALRALTPGKYGIGLPFQGEFFPRDEWFETRAAKAKADAKGADPAAITDASLVKWTGTRFTATWAKDKKDKDGNPAPGWDMAKAGGRAVDRIKSAELKKAIKDLNGGGYTIYVFPDNDNHIHIQTP